MRRAFALLFVAALLAACAADAPEADGAGFGAGSASYLDGTADVGSLGGPGEGPRITGAADQDRGQVAFAAQPVEVPAGGATGTEVEVDQLERQLRAQLATVGDPAPVAIELAALLCDLERHEEASAVLATARRRSSDAALRIAQASVQRDLGQRHLAAAELGSLCREQGAMVLHPGLLFELAELQWLEGQAELAKATLVELQQAHADHPWCAQNANALRALAVEIANLTAPSRVRVRDLLGNLRGAPVELVRLRTLEELVGLARADGKADASPAAMRHLHERAIAIACGDDSPTVRARAVQLATPTAAALPGFCREAMADSAAVVRQHAAARAVELGERAVPLLLASLEQESDERAFLAIHDALTTLIIDPPRADRTNLASAERRATVVQAWRQRQATMADPTVAR